MLRILPLVAAVFLHSAIFAQNEGVGLPVASDPSLRPTLEAIYHSWRSAMAAENIPAWEKVTALSRQMEIRNRIVSQKLPFPEALLEDPVQAPSLNGLIALGVFSTGSTATSTYFGKANFGEGQTAVTDNLLVLHFLREEGIWKFDNVRVVKIGNDGDILLKIRNSDFSFLKGEEFLPAKTLPPLPQPASAPDYIAEVWITSAGYESEVRVNGFLAGKLSNSSGKDLVIGGVRRGVNSIEIKTKRLPVGEEIAPRLEVAIYAAAGPGEKANRVFHFPSTDAVQPLIRQNFNGE